MPVGPSGGRCSGSSDGKSWWTQEGDREADGSKDELQRLRPDPEPLSSLERHEAEAGEDRQRGRTAPSAQLSDAGNEVARADQSHQQHSRNLPVRKRAAGKDRSVGMQQRAVRGGNEQ